MGGTKIQIIPFNLRSSWFTFYLLYRKITILLDHKNKRPLNINSLSQKINYSKNGAEKMIRSLYIYLYINLAL